MSPDDREPDEDQSEIDQRAAYEAELSRLTSIDVMAQAVVSLLNVGARRLAPAGDPQGAGAAGATAPERDLEQARDAIDAVRALLGILERRIPRELTPLRDALSRLQMAYAHEVGPSAAAQPGAGQQTPGAGQQAPGAGEQAPGAGEQAPGAGPQGAPGGGAQGPDPARPGEARPGPGPAESSGRLWVPGR